jgi:hypothetical protein
MQFLFVNSLSRALLKDLSWDCLQELLHVRTVLGTVDTNIHKVLHIMCYILYKL